MVILVSISYVYMVVLVPSALIAPLSYALWNYRRLPASLKWFTGYLLLNAAGNILAAWLASRRINNLPVLHVYTVFEFVLLSLCYRKLLAPRMKGWIYIVMSLFVVFCMVNSMFLQSIYKYNSYARSVSAILVSVYAIQYFKHTLDSSIQSATLHKVFSWINAGLLIYFAGSFFLFLLANQILGDFFMNTIVWNVHATLVLLMYSLFTVGLYHAKRFR